MPAHNQGLAGAGLSQTRRVFDCMLAISALMLQEPAVDGFDIEAPIATHVERWNLALLQKPINRALMDVQIG